MPPAGDLRQVVGRGLDVDDGEAGGGKQPLVLSGRHEEEVANRGPDRKFLAVEDAGDRDWVGEEQPPSRSQHSRPLAEQAGPVGKVIDRVDADERIEGAVLERERLPRVCLREARTRLQARLVRAPRRLRDRLIGELGADYVAARPLRDVQSGTARPAADVQHARAGSKVEPGEEAVELIDREPAVLADVLTEG